MRISLKTKLSLAFILVGLISVGVTGWQSFENARSTLEKITFDRLTAIRETKRRQIETYFEQLRNQALTFSESRTVIDVASDLCASAENRSKAAHSEYHPMFERYASRFGFEDILIADVKTAQVVYSVRQRADFGADLRSKRFDGTNIGEVFLRASAHANEEGVFLVDFAPYAIANSIPTSFIATPVHKNGAAIAVIIFEMSVQHLNDVMTSNKNWRAEGLGETGETYIVGSDFTMRTDSRFFIQEPQRYFEMLMALHHDSSLVGTIRRHGTSILFQKAKTDATVDALQGHTSTQVVRDYRGVEVISSYAPLRIPDVQWVMLAEIDTGEAFSSIANLRSRLMLFAFAIVILASLLSMLISRAITKPVLALTTATEHFGKADLSERVEVETEDEIGLLAGTFNRMADRTEQYMHRLEDEIAERKLVEEEVRSSRERLRNLSAHIQSVREEERKSLAREIHDELGQALTALKLNLSLLSDDTVPLHAEAEKKLADMKDMIDTTIRAVKRIITSLRPRVLDDLGLVAAIEWQAKEFSRHTGIECDLSIHPRDFEIDAERSTSLFRIFQETLTNIARHSAATNVTVHLTKTDEEIELIVQDDGKGITVEEAGASRSFGLIGIRERAYYWGGAVGIQGAPGQGTTIEVHIPWKEEPQA